MVAFTSATVPKNKKFFNGDTPGFHCYAGTSL